MCNLQKIIDCSKKYQLVIAAAGTGKTYVLIRTLVGRIKNGMINPFSKKEKIIVFTFTNNAADELMFRLSQELSQDVAVLNRMYIGTIHGWCNKYLDEMGKLSNTKIIDELERSQLIRRIYDLLKIDDAYPGKNPFNKIDQFEKDLEFFYNECLDVDDEIIPEKIRDAIRNYLMFLEKNRLIDFGSLIRKSIKILNEKNDPTIRYHIFVDEYQDVNPAQVKLIKAIIHSFPNSTLFAVGDPRQTIYQWRGSDIRRILNFNEDFGESVEIFNLTKNYRSRTGIVELANVISKKMPFYTQVPEEIIPIRSDSKFSVIIDPESVNHEERIVKEIKNLHNKNVRYSDIAIIMRSVIYQGKRLMELLDKEGIPYYSPNKNSGIDFIQEFMNSIIRLMEIMSTSELPRNQDEERELEEEIENLLLKIKKYCPDTTSTIDIHKAVADWYNKLTKEKKLVKNKRIYPNEAYNFRKQFFDFCEQINFTISKEQLEIQEGFAAITQIMRAIEEIYRRRLDGIGNIRPSPLDVFLNNIKWQLNNQIERWTDIGMDLKYSDKVTISTVHAAKGLQWPVVFLPYLVEGIFPHNPTSHDTSFPDEIASRYGTTREDERRLFYVAVTRARDRLYLYMGCPPPYESSKFIDLKEVQNKSGIIITHNSTNNHHILSDIESYNKDSYYHIGVSNFIILLECPYHFYLRYIIGVNVPVGEEFGAGNIIHKVIERIAKTKDKANFKKIIEEETYLPLGEYELQVITQKSIEKKISNLINNTSILDEIETTEYPFIISFYNIVVSGIIDATKKSKDGYEIIDWKSKVKKEFMCRYKNQIRMYAIGLKSLGYKVLRGIIYDLSEKNPNNSSIIVETTENILNCLYKFAEKRVKDLQVVGPEIKPTKWACEICDVKQLCPYLSYKKVENGLYEETI